MKNYLYGFIVIAGMSSCGAIFDSTHTDFDEGFYTQYAEEGKKQIYVDITEETIKVFPAGNGDQKIDSTAAHLKYPKRTSKAPEEITPFWDKSFDLDLHTILLKYRPALSGVPPQLNADLNATAYLGYRVDRHKLKYKTDPLGNYEIRSGQIAFSIGVFTGIGNTFMSPTTTAGNIESEYDGVVWLNGVTTVVGWNGFTAGISLGFDSLLDENSKSWIYQGKPWLGLSVGFNLN